MYKVGYYLNVMTILSYKYLVFLYGHTEID